MLRRLTEAERAAQLVEAWEPQIRSAWLAAIDGLRNGVVLRVIVERLERGDVDGAVRVLRLDREAFGQFEIALEQAFNAGGTAEASALALREPEGHRVQSRWNVRDPQSEAWLRNHSASLVTGIVEEQRDLARRLLSEGLARGDNPRTTALDLVGRISRPSGSRTGGVLGLSAPHASATEKARQALLSGDLAGMRDYLSLKRRDRRFDASVRKAIEAEKGIARADVDRIVGRLSDSYLKLRADTISLHETFTALGQSRNEAFRQAISRGDVDARDVVKTWRHQPQEHPRMQHVAMHGQTVRFDQPFIALDGTPIMYPHADGVPASHTLGCKCRVDYAIDHTAALIRRRAA